MLARVRAASPIWFIELVSRRIIANGLVQGSQSPGQVVDVAWGGRPTSRVKGPERDSDAQCFGIAGREVVSRRRAIPQQRIRRRYKASVRVTPFETGW